MLDAQPGGWFTSDIWSTDNSPDKFLALNFHCFDDIFVYWKFTLGLQTFDDRKTGQEIFSQWILCFIEWGFLSAIGNVPEFHDHNGKRVRNVNAYTGWDRVYGIVCDNGPNVQAAADYLPQESIDDSPPCLGHTVQLVVHDSIDSQRAVIDVLAIGRNLVAFFNKSKPGKSMLLQLQKDGGVARPLTVVRSVEPRWDSELAMLERLVKLRPFICDVAEHELFRNKVTVYKPHQWDLATSIISLLCPVQVLTK